MATLTITTEQYLALATLARQGLTDQGPKSTLEAFLLDIEKSNNITRYLLQIRWQELKAPVPPGFNFPQTWPPTLSGSIERLDRPIAKLDVTAYVSSKAVEPINIMVTKDPGGLYGWTKLDDFFH